MLQNKPTKFYGFTPTSESNAKRPKREIFPEWQCLQLIEIKQAEKRFNSTQVSS